VITPALGAASGDVVGSAPVIAAKVNATTVSTSLGEGVATDPIHALSRVMIKQMGLIRRMGCKGLINGSSRWDVNVAMENCESGFGLLREI